MRLGWTDESIAYFLDAAAQSDYYRIIAQKIAKALPRGAHVCDAGCGVGALSLALLPHCDRVTAIDVSAPAVESLRFRAAERVTALCGDVEELRPEKKYDAMVFCLFGSTEQALKIAKAQCAGKVFLVKRDYDYHRFSVGELELGRYGAARTEEVLRARGIPFESESFCAEFGQPFRSLGAAERFFALYAHGQERFTMQEIREKLVRREDGEFPYYLPHEKKLRLFTFDVNDGGGKSDG